MDLVALRNTTVNSNDFRVAGVNSCELFPSRKITIEPVKKYTSYTVIIKILQKNFMIYSITHTTLFIKAWQIQNIDISVRKEKNI